MDTIQPDIKKDTTLPNPFFGYLDTKITASTISVENQAAVPESEHHYQSNLKMISEDEHQIRIKTT